MRQRVFLYEGTCPECGKHVADRYYTVQFGEASASYPDTLQRICDTKHKEPVVTIRIIGEELPSAP